MNQEVYDLHCALKFVFPFQQYSSKHTFCDNEPFLEFVMINQISDTIVWFILAKIFSEKTDQYVCY